MNEDNALRNLRYAVYTPIVLGVFFLGLDFFGGQSEALPDFNRLFSVMTPLQTVGGFLLVVGTNTVICFRACNRTLESKE